MTADNPAIQRSAVHNCTDHATSHGFRQVIPAPRPHREAPVTGGSRSAPRSGRSVYHVLPAFVLLVSAGLGHALGLEPGDLDPAFGVGGAVITEIGGAIDGVDGLAIQ